MHSRATGTTTSTATSLMHAHSTNRTPRFNPNTSLSPPTAHPVCGSLDPPSRSKKSRTGWRYIQLTDTKDELRVLLPPRPAAIYANLLKVEAYNLAKNTSDAKTSREIHRTQYLKDAMLKRCRKLVQDSLQVIAVTPGSPPISVVEAPLDFKINRLERWWEETELQVKPKNRPSQAHVERQGGMQTINSTATLSPSKNHTQGGAVGQTSYASETHPVSVSNKQRPAPLTVSPPGYTVSAQSSPSVQQIPRSPNRSSRRTSIQISPQVPAATQRPVYSNTQLASHLENPYNPAFDPNQSLATHHAHATPATTHLNIPVSAYSPSVPRNDPRMDSQHVYGSADALTEPAPQPDPSHLKNRFHATYMTSPPNSGSSPSSSGSKQPGHSPQNLEGGWENISTHPPPAALHRTLPRAHGSLSVPLPTSTSPYHEMDHRRRATVDCEDTDRSVPRPKAYMYGASAAYATSHDVSPELYYNDSSYTAQDTQKPSGNPSAIQRVARMFNQGLVAGGSPHSSVGSQGSPRLRASPAGSYALEGSPHSQNSPGKGAQVRSYGPSLTVGQTYAYSNGGSNTGSPNLLSPDPVISRSHKSSTEYEVHASRQALPSQAGSENQYPNRTLRRTVSRRGLHEGMRDGSEPNGQPVVPPAEYFISQTRSPRTSPPNTQQLVEAEYYQRGRTRRGEPSSRRRSTCDASPRRGDVVIPDMATYAQVGSNRDSRYTSGGSSVSEPVIPDVSLIFEAEANRHRGDPVRRRLIPYASSSEEAGSRRMSHFDDSDLSSDEDDGVGNVGGYYKPPHRTRDGYGSGYASEAEGAKFRTPSRAASRSPTRSILKRSSSVCSQRSNKSVRLEIPRDRRALEEVRDAEDKVERARKQLDDMQRRKGSRTKPTDPEIREATGALDQAKRSLKEKVAEYQAILVAMKVKHSEINETQPLYV